MNLINDLLNAGIISADDARSLNSQFTTDLTGSKLLYKLHSYLLDKVVPQRPKGGYTLTLYDNSIKSEAECIQANILLDILLSYQIISSQTWQKLQACQIPNTTGGFIAILHMAAEHTAYDENFVVQKQLAFADILFGERKRATYTGILDEDQFEKLKIDIQSKKLNTYVDFFSYSYCTAQLSVTEHMPAQQVLDLLIPALNKLIFDSFSIAGITIAEEEYHGHPTYDNHLVKLLLNTGVRWRKHSYTCSNNTRSGKISNRELVENALLLINDTLADFATQYRFTALTNYTNPQLFPEDDRRYMLCRLGVQQASIFDFYVLQKHSLFNQPHVFFNHVLSYRHIEYLVYHFKTYGLLDHLSEQAIREVTSQLQEQTYNNADQLLAAFPGTIAVAGRYATPNQPPYEQLLPQLGNISRGILNFTDISDGTPTLAAIGDEATYYVSFKCNGILHNIKCEYAYGELNEGVLYYLGTEILRKNLPELMLVHLAVKDINQYAYTIINRRQLEHLNLANINLGTIRY